LLDVINNLLLKFIIMIYIRSTKRFDITLSSSVVYT